MVRKIDNLGRIVIPKEARKSLKISEGTPLEISWDAQKGHVILRKAASACAICGNTRELAKINEVTLCEKCYKKLFDEK